MIRRLIAAIGVVLPLGLFAMSPPQGLGPEGLKALALAVFAISFFVTETIPLAWTGFILLLLFVLLGVVPSSVAFSGFTSSAFWLVFASFLLGGGMLRTGLARRMAFAFIRVLGNRYGRVVMGFCVLGFLLSFGVPSGNARVALLIPIALEIAAAFGLPLKSRGCAGLALAVAMSAFFPGFALLPSNVPNLVHAGVIESVGGPTISYGLWAALHLPVLGMARVAMIYVVIRLFLWPKEVPVLKGESLRAGDAGPLSRDEWKMITWIGIAIGLWMTDFIHGVKPVWVGLGAAMATLLPGVGVLEKKDVVRCVNLPLLVYLASILALGRVLAATGVSRWVGEYIIRVIPLAEMGSNEQVAVVALITLSLAILTTQPAVPAVLTPIIVAYAMDHGLDVTRLVMAQVLGIGICFFPYQTPPLVNAQGYGAFTGRQVLRVLIPFAVLSVILVIPLTILYWRFIGFLP